MSFQELNDQELEQVIGGRKSSVKYHKKKQKQKDSSSLECQVPKSVNVRVRANKGQVAAPLGWQTDQENNC